MADTNRYFSSKWWENNLLLAGLGLGMAYWLLESALHVYIFREGGMARQLLAPDPHELWMRMMVEALLVGFSIYAQTVVNARKRVEETLLRREKEAKDILENNPAGIVLVDAETRRISWVNSNALKMTGAAREDIVGRVCHDHLCPAERAKCPVLDRGQPLDRSERTLIATGGKRVPILKSVTQVTYQDRDHLLEAFFDISKQKEMQKAIRSANAELEQIFQTASVGMRLIDHAFNILKVNDTFARLSGLPASAAVGRKCFEVFSGSKCHTHECPLTQTLNGQKPAEHLVDKTQSDGRTVPCILRSTPFVSPEGDIIGIVESFQDISDLTRIQEELRAERDKLHRILFQQLECVSIVNTEKEIEYQNEIAQTLFQDAVGRKCYEVYHRRQTPCADCHMGSAISSGEIQRCEFDTPDLKAFEQTYTPFLDVDSRKKVVVSFRDITEQKAARLVAMRSERLSALGELAAGVAHEINNPINGIINYAQILINRHRENQAIGDISGRIVKEGNRIARIVQSLLSFARQDEEERSMATLEEILGDALTLTAAQLRKDGIRMSLDIPPDLPEMIVQPQKIQQVFVNLISNARYALRQKGGPPSTGLELRIAAATVESNGQMQVRIEFTDNGIGIPADIMGKVMNPFFSAKPKGSGTGLGLSISHGIIQDHGGNLSIQSKEGEFTLVTIELPAAKPAGKARIAS